jgi:hypothetical protein
MIETNHKLTFDQILWIRTATRDGDLVQDVPQALSDRCVAAGLVCPDAEAAGWRLSEKGWQALATLRRAA